MASVTFQYVTKRFDDFVAVNDLSIDIADQEFLVFVGPSGCGKTTSLRLLAGLESVTEGHIYIGDRRVNDMSPKDRDIAMVFQSYALYPHMTVFENMAFSLELQGKAAAIFAIACSERPSKWALRPCCIGNLGSCRGAAAAGGGLSGDCA
jgi:multiple sugar transport system ATP-binding protein